MFDIQFSCHTVDEEPMLDLQLVSWILSIKPFSNIQHMDVVQDYYLAPTKIEDYLPRKLTWQWDTPPFEDVFPIEHRDFPLPC